MHESALDVALEAAKAVNLPESRILVVGGRITNRHQTWRDFCGSRLADETRGKITPHKDIAFLCYSSGTTGLPKGVMLSHRNIVANLHQIQPIEGNHLMWQRDKLAGLLPLYHIYGLANNLHLPVFNGIPVVIHAKFGLPSFLESIQKHRITFVHTVPPIILLLAKDPLVSKYDLSSLRMINSAAAPLTLELTTAVYKRLNVPIKQAYGATETAPITLDGIWSDWKVFGSAGSLVPNVEAKIVDYSGKSVETGKDGELWVRGPNIMLG